MKTKVDKKKPPSSSSSSSSESSSDEEIKVTSKVTPAKHQAPALKQKDVAKSSPAIPTPVPANKFPKRAAKSSSSSSSSSSSDDEPAKKKVATSAQLGKQQANKAFNTTPSHKANSTTTTTNNNNTNNNNKAASKFAAKESPFTPKPVAPVVQPSPKHAATPKQPSVITATPQALSPKKATGPITSAGDESFSKIETKKTVKNVFDSNCPHCGKEIEVKIKLG